MTSSRKGAAAAAVPSRMPPAARPRSPHLRRCGRFGVFNTFPCLISDGRLFLAAYSNFFQLKKFPLSEQELPAAAATTPSAFSSVYSLVGGVLSYITPTRGARPMSQADSHASPRRD